MESGLCVKVPCASYWNGQGGGVLQGSMLNLLMLIIYLFLMECFEIFIICRRPPILQTDDDSGMITKVGHKTEGP